MSLFLEKVIPLKKNHQFRFKVFVSRFSTITSTIARSHIGIPNFFFSTQIGSSCKNINVAKIVVSKPVWADSWNWRHRQNSNYNNKLWIIFWQLFSFAGRPLPDPRTPRSRFEPLPHFKTVIASVTPTPGRPRDES